jgi:hypothetical protein
MKPGQTGESARFSPLISIVLLFVTLSASHPKAAAKLTPQASAAVQPNKDLAGVWVLVGTPDKVGEPPSKGGRLKFFSGRHWCITESDPATGEVVFHHGGTYTINGDELVETVEYASSNTVSLIKQVFKHKIKIEGDKFTQVGIGNPWQEVWKRLK